MVEFDRAEKGQLVAATVGLAVYAGVALAAARIWGVGFWWVLAGLIAVRTFFSIVEAIASFIHWRMFGKRATVANVLRLLRANKFPPREFPDDDFSTYICRLASDYAPQPDVHRAAHEFDVILRATVGRGVLADLRFNAACDAALNEYSARTPAS